MYILTNFSSSQPAANTSLSFLNTRISTLFCSTYYTLYISATLLCFVLISNTARGQVQVGAEQLNELLPLLKNQSVGLVVNHTSRINQTHLADSLVRLGVSVKKIFGPEHGFRGDAADGETINDSIDLRTGIKIISLYGKNNKPTPAQLTDLDFVVFDIQDVGARFYTYISTLHYVMEACAENTKKLIVLDRPNPNGSYVDGPIREAALTSFVGMHPIPIVHGMTVGELAQMINGEGWLKNKQSCNLHIIKIKNWKHTDEYSLPINPSPNLPNDQAIRLYPSLCLFEGTVISVGRGTPTPFQIIGNPQLTEFPFSFTPAYTKGYSTDPPHKNKLCYGLDLRQAKVARKVDLKYLLEFYQKYPDKENFFSPYFDKLAGTSELKQQIKQSLTEAQIRKTWKHALNQFKKMQKKYLLYP